MHKKIEWIEVEKLRLDTYNPRLPLSYQNKDEKEIIEWMLLDASIVELMLSIGQNDFFNGEVLLVIPNGNNYIVVEGNRRLTAVKVLNNRSLATVQKNQIETVFSEIEHIYIPKELPCIIFDSREEVLSHLGYKHVTGVKAWSALSKARYLNQLKNKLMQDGKKDLNQLSKELAKTIGSKPNYVKRTLISFEIYKNIEDEKFFKIKELDDTTFHFSYLQGCLNKEYISNFIDVDLDKESPLEELSRKNLKELIHWFFDKNLKNRIIGDSNHLKMLNAILNPENKKALKMFREGEPISECYEITQYTNSSFTSDLKQALHKLEKANNYIHKLKNHPKLDTDTLMNIVSMCRIMKQAIESKEKDEFVI